MTHLTGQDDIWHEFTEVLVLDQPNRAVCNHCNMEMAANVVRMKHHFNKTCKRERVIEPRDEVQAIPVRRPTDSTVQDVAVATSSSGTIGKIKLKTIKKRNESNSKFVGRTSSADKIDLDLQVARFVYATNSSFTIVQHAEFKKLISLLRPGYNPPTFQSIETDLLNSVYLKQQTDIKQELNGKTVCMALDGWSNAHSDLIVCVCVTDILSGNVHLIDTIDTEDNNFTWDYLTTFAVNSLKFCEGFGCTVGSLVMDNSYKMAKMRQKLATHDGALDVITYGCSAHWLNLLARDIEVHGIQSSIIKIIKYFKYVHFVAAKYKLAGGKPLILPRDGRLNSLVDSVQSYIDNWPIFNLVCVENIIANISQDIVAAVKNKTMRSDAEKYLVKLKQISISLGRIQSDTCTISEAMAIWIDLKEYFESDEVNDPVLLGYFQERYKVAITPYHELSYILDHRYQDKKLTDAERNDLFDYLNLNHPEILPELMHYIAEAAPFSKDMFTQQTVTPIKWWLEMEKHISPVLFGLTQKMFTAVASSSGVERLFSSFGLDHSKIRNQLGVEKSLKLVSVFKRLNIQMPKT